ncbi:LysR family transcriptional regulator [Cochlodiniinecator piscidefendens]|uniref:LysR family transcriptional regulator n=1 Tax=Cochlodiniinecator piscidefendens TaxID=2715756 RepID=UPI00140E32BA|nr:LysR family transcriptional regulator [Cochlodiniinecator piscidefendens]
MKLPPLNALKAFEATVRHGSFTAAAVELGVSAAAVSMQIKRLEEFLGKALFFRKNNSIVLTDSGHLLFPQTTQSLSDISLLTERFMDNDIRSRLVVSTIQSLAERCAAPAVAAMRIKHPNLGIEVQIESDPVDLVKQRIDLRLTYGDQHYAEIPKTELFHEDAIPMCSPNLALQLDLDPTLSHIPDEQLIHVNWGQDYMSYPTWGLWFASQGIDRQPDVTKGLRAAGSAVAVAMACAHAGVVLAPRRLAGYEHRVDSLKIISNHMIKLSQPYFGIGPKVISDDNAVLGKYKTYLRDLVELLKTHPVEMPAP